MKFLRVLFLFLMLMPLSAWAQMVHFPGEIMIQLKPEGRLEQVISDLRTVNGTPTGLVEDFEISPIMRYWLLRYDQTAIAEDRLMFLMRSHPAVEEAQWNHHVALRDSVSPNDTNLGNQWQWINNGGGTAVSDADVDANQAWNITTGGLTSLGDTIVACVVDDGISYTHTDLVGNLWVNNNEIPGNDTDDDGNGYIDDIYGWNSGNNSPTVSGGSHGINVSGMIGAKGNNAAGGTGINWDVKLMTVKYGGASEAQVIAAYNYPLVMRKMYNESNGQLGAFVVVTNSSWGIDSGQPSDAPLWCAFYDTLGTYGILSVAATTNANLDVDVVGDLPTACPSEYMVGVARTGSADNHAGGYGATKIPLGAPGISIYTTSGNNSGYTTTTGTSFASPLVAGIVALMYSAPCDGFADLAKSDPAAAALLVKQKILEGVDVIPALQGKVSTNGRANAHKALLGLLENCGSCINPSGVSIDGIGETAATVNFIPADSASVTIRYKSDGATDWIVVENATSPYIINDLIVCRTYILQFKTYCGEEESSNWSSSFVFSTSGCCEAPAVEAPVAFEDAMIFNWAADTNLTYVIEYAYNGQSGSDTVTAGTFTLLGLPPCTIVEWRINSFCPNGTFNEGTWATKKTPGCGACADLTYCLSTPTDATEEWIASVSIANFTHTSGGGSGYSDFTGLPEVPELAQGSTYPVSITPGFSGSTFTEAMRMWIDYDQNGTFETTELVFSPGNSTTTVTGDVTIPLTATLGVTRMRVVAKYMGAGSSQPQPCQQFQYGEFEDYCVKIVEPVALPACQVVETPTVSDTTHESAVITWPAADSATSYTLQYRVASTTVWTTISNVTSPYTLTNLSDNTSYVVRVRAICPNGDADASGLVEFQTQIESNANDLIGTLAFSAAPNPVADVLSAKLNQPVTAAGQLKLTNAAGQIVKQMPVSAGTSTWQMSTAGLPAGSYILTLEAESVWSLGIVKL